MSEPRSEFLITKIQSEVIVRCSDLFYRVIISEERVLSDHP